MAIRLRTRVAVLCLAGALSGCAASSDRTALQGDSAPSRSHLVLLLSPDCRLDQEAGTFLLPDGSEFSPSLSSPFELRPMVTDLARRKRSELSEDEERLASYLLLLTGTGKDLAAALQEATTWPCVEEARESPQVALP